MISALPVERLRTGEDENLQMSKLSVSGTTVKIVGDSIAHEVTSHFKASSIEVSCANKDESSPGVVTRALTVHLALTRLGFKRYWWRAQRKSRNFC